MLLRLLRSLIPARMPDLWRYRRNLSRVRREGAGEGPVSLNLFVTDRCNLRCKMCANHRPDKADRSDLVHNHAADMTSVMLRTALELFPTVKRACFAGVGEPLLVKDIFQMVNVAAQAGVECGMVSNGVLLQERMDDLLGSKLRHLYVSLNAGSSGTYSDLVGLAPEAFAGICEGVRVLLKRRVEENPCLSVSTSAVFRPGREEEAIEFVRCAAELGVDEIFLHGFLPDPSRPADLEQVSRRHHIRHLAALAKAVLSGRRSRLILPAAVEGTPRRKCLSFFNTMNLDGDGNVGGCLRMVPPSRGNGNLADGRQVWHKQYFLVARANALSIAGRVSDCCNFCAERYV